MRLNGERLEVTNENSLKTMKRNKYSPTWENDFYWLKASRVSEFYALCTLCKQYFNVDGFGRSQVVGHSKSPKHIEIEKNRNIITTPSSSKTLLNEDFSAKLNKDEEVIGAEILWTLKCIENAYTFDGFYNYAPFFNLMFPDSTISKNLDFTKSKLKFLALNGIVPYVENQIRINLTGSPFALIFDEAYSEGKKQLHAYIQYWSNSDDKFVKPTYCGSILLCRRKTNVLKEFFFELAKKFNLDCSLLLQISSNLKFQKLILKDLEDLHSTSILDISTCCALPIYTAFVTGLNCITFPYMEFLNDMLFFLKFSNLKREENKKLEVLSENLWKFFGETSFSKWLQFKVAILKIIENYGALKECVAQAIPKCESLKKEVENFFKYKYLLKVLKDRRTLVYLSFIVSVIDIFEPLLLEFLKNGPLIYTLYDELSKLLFELMSQFLKKSAILKNGKKADGDFLMCVDCKNIEFHLDNIFFNNSKKQLNVQVSTNSKMVTEMQKEFLQFFVESCSYLQKTLPLSSTFLKDVRHLHPLRRDLESITRVAETVIDVIGKSETLNCLFCTEGKDKGDLCDLIGNQAKLFMSEKDLACDNVMEYWKRLGQMKNPNGETKYLQLYILVKCVMVLNCGYFPSEKDLMINQAILAKSEDEQVAYSIRLIRDYLGKIGGIQNFVIDKDIYKMVKISQKKCGGDFKKTTGGVNRISFRKPHVTVFK